MTSHRKDSKTPQRIFLVRRFCIAIDMLPLPQKRKRQLQQQQQQYCSSPCKPLIEMMTSRK